MCFHENNVSRQSMKEHRTSNDQCIKGSMTVIIASSQSYKNEIILTIKNAK
jgi:hypothetical protein